VDLSKLTTSDKLILGGGIAYLIFMFFPWYGLAGGSNNGWDYFLGGVLPLILIVVMCLQVALTRFSPDTNLPTLPLSWGQVHLIAGGVAAVLVILRLIIGSSIDAGIVEIDLDRKFGLILATLAAIAVAIGGYLKFQESGGTEAAGGPSTGTAPF
jgi:hypothetical protein